MEVGHPEPLCSERLKTTQAASVKSRGGERCGCRRTNTCVRYEPKKANESKPLMTCRNRIDGIKTEGNRYIGTSLGENLLTAQVVPGIEVARAWLRLWQGTWEPVASNVVVGLGQQPAQPPKGEPQAAETARGRVPT